MHPYLGDALRWLVLAHVVAAFFFVLFHGPSVYVMWRLRREREPVRVAALLDLSSASMGASWNAMGALAITGALLAATEDTWTLWWVWGSIVVLVVVSLSMSWLAARPFNHARSALGSRYFDGRRMQEETRVVDEAAFPAALRMIRARTPGALAIGAMGLLALVWLMVERPT